MAKTPLPRNTDMHLRVMAAFLLTLGIAAVAAKYGIHLI